MVESKGYQLGMGDLLSKSMAIQVVFEYFSQSEKIQMQRLNKRFYNLFVPYLVNEVKLYDMGNVTAGIVAFPGQNYLNLLEASSKPDSLCNWKQLKLTMNQKPLVSQYLNEGEKNV